VSLFDGVGKTIAGVDGCPKGWVAAIRSITGALHVEVFPSFAALIDSMPADAVVAVDMPIGLPEFTRRGGRGPEALVRPLLGQRQSSVFSIPSRAAVWAETATFTSIEAWYKAHSRASDIARETSDPPRGVSIQAFAIFPKIREIDALLRERSALRARVHESHPEVAFWRLNGERPVATPKKIGGKVNPAGMDERRSMLADDGLDADFVRRSPPAGAATDDFLDACAMLTVAARIARGVAASFPEPPESDSLGLPIAIWA